MSQIVHAYIEHRLTAEEIIKLPDYLQHIQDSILAGKWDWTTPNMTEQTLVHMWTLAAEYFINNQWSEKDLAFLQKGNMTFFFSNPHLVTFDNLQRWDTYHSNEQLREEFNSLAKTVSSLLRAVDVLIVPDLSSVDFFDEDEDLTVDSYRQKANGNRIYAVELDKLHSKC